MLRKPRWVSHDCTAISLGSVSWYDQYYQGVNRWMGTVIEKQCRIIPLTNFKVTLIQITKNISGIGFSSSSPVCQLHWIFRCTLLYTTDQISDKNMILSAIFDVVRTIRAKSGDGCRSTFAINNERRRNLMLEHAVEFNGECDQDPIEQQAQLSINAKLLSMQYKQEEVSADQTQFAHLQRNNRNFNSVSSVYVIMAKVVRFFITARGKQIRDGRTLIELHSSLVDPVQVGRPRSNRLNYYDSWVDYMAATVSWLIASSCWSKQ